MGYREGRKEDQKEKEKQEAVDGEQRKWGGDEDEEERQEDGEREADIEGNEDEREAKREEKKGRERIWGEKRRKKRMSLGWNGKKLMEKTERQLENQKCELQN